MKSAQECFKTNLKRLREEADFTQLSFSEAIGVSLRGYQKYEQGVVWPEPAKLDRMAKVLGVPLVALFDGGMMPASAIHTKGAKAELSQMTKAKRNREAAQMLGAKGKRLEAKAPPDFGAASAFLERYKGLEPERKALVAMLVYDDEAYLLDHPALALKLANLLKG